MEGFRPGKKENKLGIRASDTAEVVMEDCFVSDGPAARQGRRGLRPGAADPRRRPHLDRRAGARHGHRRLRRRRSRYSKEREQFGKPIAEFQAIQFTLAEMATRIAAAELLTFAAAEAMDRGERVTRLASEAKLFAGEAAVFCSERGVQIHGGYGFIKDYRAEKYYRDVKLCTIGEGTSEIQRLVIARQLLKRR